MSRSSATAGGLHRAEVGVRQELNASGSITGTGVSPRSYVGEMRQPCAFKVDDSKGIRGNWWWREPANEAAQRDISCEGGGRI